MCRHILCRFNKLPFLSASSNPFIYVIFDSNFNHEKQIGPVAKSYFFELRFLSKVKLF